MITHSGACSRATRHRRIGRWLKLSACSKRWERRGWAWKWLRARKRLAQLLGKARCRGITFPSVARVEGRILSFYTPVFGGKVFGGNVFAGKVFVDHAAGDIVGRYAVFAALYLQTQRFDSGIAGSERVRKVGDRGGVGIGVGRFRHIAFCRVQPSGVGLGSLLRLRGAIQIIDSHLLIIPLRPS